MYKNKRILSVIVARGGSKGLPGKNTMLIGGRPMIAWSIGAARKSLYLDKHIISTDDVKIKDIAIQHGAYAPFIRPDELATDDASIDKVIEHAVNFLAEEEEYFDLVVILQATSPLRSHVHIDEAIKLFVDSSVTSDTTLVSVCKAEQKIQWLLQETKDGFVNFVFDQARLARNRQKLKQYYLPNGAIYILNSEKVAKGIYGDATLFFEMSRESSIDIDTLEDFENAERALEHFNF